MNEFMIARLFVFVWLGSALCSADGICAEAAGVPGVAWLAGEVDESWTPIHTHAPASRAVTGAVTMKRVL